MRARKTCLSSLFRIQCVFGSPLHSPVRLSLLVMFLGLPGLWGWDGEACARFGGDTGPRELQCLREIAKEPSLLLSGQ